MSPRLFSHLYPIIHLIDHLIGLLTLDLLRLSHRNLLQMQYRPMIQFLFLDLHLFQRYLLRGLSLQHLVTKIIDYQRHHFMHHLQLLHHFLIDPHLQNLNLPELLIRLQS